MEECLKRHPYSAIPRGPADSACDRWGNNCQTSTLLTVGNCCLKSNWKPHVYAGHPRGRCLEEELMPDYGVVGYPMWMCVRWEVPEWRDNTPPIETDPDTPSLP